MNSAWLASGRALTLAFILMTPSTFASDTLTCERLVDHRNSSLASTNTPVWYSVNDNVMGGRSRGGAALEENGLVFSGNINTQGGGFASVRHDLSAGQLRGFDRLRLSVRSDGRGYSIHLRDNRSAAARIAHRVALPPRPSDDFQTIEVLFSALAPTFRGRAVSAEPFDPSEAESLSIMLSDGVDGPFTLAVEWIDACRVL